MAAAHDQVACLAQDGRLLVFPLDELKRQAAEKARGTINAWVAEQTEGHIRDLIPAGALCEIRFEDLEKDPVGQIRRVYRELNLPDFEQALPKIEQYAASLSGYKKNVFTPLPGPVREKVSRAWTRNFREWGYPV